MPPQNITTTKALSLNLPWVLWGGLGLLGGGAVAGVYPIYTIQNLVVSFVISFFFICLLKKRIYLPPGRRFRQSKEVKGKNAVYACSVFLVIAVCWGIYSGYFSFMILKYNLMSLGLMLAYAYILIAFFNRVGDYYQEQQNQKMLETN